MADLTFHQELIRSGVQTLAVVLGGGLSVLTGWLLLRRQERIKRDEELAAGMRRVRIDALVRALEAIGRYHSEAGRLRGWQKVGLLNEKQREHFSEDMRRANDSTRAAVNALADTWFLLGERLGEVVRLRFADLMRAQTDDEAEKAAQALEADLSTWVPRLEPHGRP